MKHYVLHPLARLCREPAFVICTLILAVGAGTLRVGAQKLQWHFRKLPLPLQRPLDALDVRQIVPYRVVGREKIDNPEIAASLGTDEYIWWHLEDPEVPEDHPARFATLFVSYYTGNPDKVPHVPDWCYVGSGGIVEHKQQYSIQVPQDNPDGRLISIPIRMLTIKLPGTMLAKSNRIVSYFFSVNGDYACTRTEVRIKQNNWRHRYAYFSKVEVTFERGHEMSAAETLRALEKLCRRVIPVLKTQHWPDWAKATRGS
ncbi:MAG: hypothetical protein JW810_04190 [Sedimentisphaerales bacterium]|nr:hypothetical protein [Sedimentisphaerales bacterium]